MNTIDQIARANFIATPAQVVALAALVATGSNADGTYLRVLLAGVQTRMGKPTPGRRPRSLASSTVAALDAVHAEFYPHVLKGVAPDEAPNVERVRKATFARTAASTVRAFIHGGGDVRAVEVATATKGALRRAIAPETVATGATRAERALNKTLGALDRTAQRLASKDPELAREQLEAAMDRLEALLQALPSTDAPPAQPRAVRQRPSAPAQAQRNG